MNFFPITKLLLLFYNQIKHYETQFSGDIYICIRMQIITIYNSCLSKNMPGVRMTLANMYVLSMYVYTYYYKRNIILQGTLLIPTITV